MLVQIVGLTMVAAIFLHETLAQPAPSGRPEFEAATIKASRDNGKGGVRATTGRFTLESVPLRLIVSVAYNIRPSQTVGGPPSSDSANFDVQGKAAEAAGTDSMLLMLQALLAERFQLKVHRETREGPVHELTIAKGGHRLKPASCLPFDPNHLPRQTGPGEVQVDYCGQMAQAGGDLRRTVDAKGVDVVPTIGLLEPSLTGLLSEALDRTVINKTGLSGHSIFI
jgi:uncharacterized protein (TIGR03435 family)